MGNAVFRKNAAHPPENGFEVGATALWEYITDTAASPVGPCGAADKALDFRLRGRGFEPPEFLFCQN